MALLLLRILGLCWLACIACTAALARDPLDEPRFTAVGDSRSINDGVVTALAQDDRGLIWIGTPVGLVRHDGYQLRNVAVGGKSGPGASPEAASAASAVRRQRNRPPGTPPTLTRVGARPRTRG